jgi:di/tricarboxylate transporter
LLLAASLAIGKAFTITGLAAGGAEVAAAYGTEMAPLYTLMALMAVTTVMTNFVSNTAAAAIMTPLSLQIGTQLGLPVEPFVLAVLFGCNLSYATPFAYQTNLLVMGAAGLASRQAETEKDDENSRPATGADHGS